MARFLCFIFMLLPLQTYAQETIFFGGGYQTDVDVYSSSDHVRSQWDQMAVAENTINGLGLDAHLIEASRFLAQATLGADERMIRETAEMGFETWIEEQVDMLPTSYFETMTQVYSEVYEIYIADNGDPNNFRCRPKWYHANYAWWQMIMGGDDLLRQRVSLALSEILVASKSRSDIEDHGFAVASFYDIFVRNAFANYEDILMEVSLHPAMGTYLSHLNNPKAIPEENKYPDENYAREMMQLFSIGLIELNIDGTPKLDENGQQIPTFTNKEIGGLAAVFTGLGGGGVDECGNAFAPAFGLSIHHIDMTVPMIVFDEFHDNGAKEIIGGYVIPAGQSGMKDIRDAVHQIFLHPNVGPFLAHKLIQFMIKSNPTPAYIERVANIFNDNGNGKRGDMKAVIKAILLDDEARSCAQMNEENNGKLREPILRYTHFARAMDKQTTTGNYWETGEYILEATNQHPMHSPSVFNFFQPNYSPSGPIEEEGIVAPEFQLHNSVTSTRYFNLVDEWTSRERIFSNWEKLSNIDKRVYLDASRLLPLSREPEVLLNKLDLLLTHGQMTQSTREIIRHELEGYVDEGIEQLYYRTLLALYTIMVSPDYVIFK